MDGHMQSMSRIVGVGILLFLWFSGAAPGVAETEPAQRQRANTQVSQPAAVPVSILSIIPVQAEPQARVMLFGSGFGESATVFLGGTEIPAKITDGRQAEFNIPPQLEPGLYALYLKRSDGNIGRPYNFTVLPLRPVLSGLTPDQINSCAQGREREVTALGRNFTERSQLFFDGAAIRSRFISPGEIVFSVPQVAGGLHHVMVKDTPENASVTQGLTIETRPEITQVTVGTEYVNYYELLVEGRNFNQDSSIYVDGQRIGGPSRQESGERERVIYIDCGHLVYLRFPYSPVNKDFRLQVVSRNGEGSQVVTVTAP
ncbi:IPT/TIG domain-containing protein [Geobacter sp. SVR]|uniref:IPT/TIG domain-containing protein n=1 Tax=Geobacter sp. SVR TaxID=2495594 RepID=UPI00143EFDC6|nr:IPT/TIG domain-containing protein [Geobacter sp. SVR]BCS53640.1 transcription factor [Geobacter sp. SVR]GCF84163.1 transcription factor [Geobacter sp. SVR]